MSHNNFSLTHLSDNDLVSRIISGPNSDAAYTEIYHRYHEKIRRYLSAKTNGNHELVDDLLQDVFIKLFSKAATYKPVADSKFSSWLYRIAHNTLITYVRSQSVKKEHTTDILEEIFASPTEESLEESYIAKENLTMFTQCMTQVLTTIDPIKRRCFELKYIEKKEVKPATNADIREGDAVPRGYTFQEIGALVGVSEDQAKKYAYGVRDEIRYEIQRDVSFWHDPKIRSFL